MKTDWRQMCRRKRSLANGKSAALDTEGVSGFRHHSRGELIEGLAKYGRRMVSCGEMTQYRAPSLYLDISRKVLVIWDEGTIRTSSLQPGWIHTSYF